jgi:predicted TIM-barrel fold metal-dependent hydrolase
MVPEFGERAPHVRRAGDGTDWWWVDDQRTNSFAGGSQAGVRFGDADALVLADAVDNVREEVWTPDGYVRENLSDGIGGSVLYPTQQMQHYAVRDTALVSATCRTYNDWLAEFCATEPERLRGIATLNVDDPSEAGAELERAAGLGLAGALVPVGLPYRQTYADPRFEPVWTAAEATGLPLSLHIGTYRADPNREKPVLIAGAPTAGRRPVQTAFANADSYVRTAIADLIFSGVLERHPGLRMISAEHEIGWLAHFVERMDHTYTQRATRGHRFANGALPSDFVRRQVWVQFCEDPHVPAIIDALGGTNVLWGADYPHSEGTFPRSREITGNLLCRCDDDVRAGVLGRNAAGLYHIDEAVLSL